MIDRTEQKEKETGAKDAAASCPHISDMVIETSDSVDLNYDVPGQQPIPLFGWRGNLLRHFRNPIASMRHLQETYGNVVSLVKGGSSSLVLRSLDERTSTIFAFGGDCNKEILTQPMVFAGDHMRGPKNFESIVETMAATTGEKRWEQRRMIAPAFSKLHLTAYYDDMVRFVQKMLDQWRPETTVDITHSVDNLCADVASKAFYGQEPENHHLNLAYIIRLLTKSLFSPVSMIPINLPGTPYRRFTDLARKASETVWREIEQKRAMGMTGDDALSMMIRNHDEGEVKLSKAGLIGNTLTLFIAGYDVPADGLGFALLLLAQHPDVAAELHEELEHRLGGRPPTFEEVWDLPVLDRVIRESLRVLCPAAIMWRRAYEDTSIGGYFIPKGSEVLLSPYITHLDPDIYLEPRRFLPDRWLDLDVSRYDYMPYSQGAHKCLGAKFSDLLLRIAVAIIIQRYRLEIIPNTKINISATATIRPKPNLQMIVRDQDRNFHCSANPVKGYIQEMVEFD